MTDDMMNLRALVEKTPDADLLREMIGFAAQRLMELEVEGLTGAGYGEKSPERKPEASRPSGTTHSAVTEFECPLRLVVSAPVFRSHNRIVSSHEPDASRPS